jgi:hypothetical protein
MSIKRSLQKIGQPIQSILERIIGYISGAVTRIFSPTDDNYPKTGVQPFEGDPADKRSL